MQEKKRFRYYTHGLLVERRSPKTCYGTVLRELFVFSFAGQADAVPDWSPAVCAPAACPLGCLPRLPGRVPCSAQVSVGTRNGVGGRSDRRGLGSEERQNLAEAS